jgi:hypothetical protein
VRSGERATEAWSAKARFWALTAAGFLPPAAGTTTSRFDATSLAGLSELMVYEVWTERAAGAGSRLITFAAGFDRAGLLGTFFGQPIDIGPHAE